MHPTWLQSQFAKLLLAFFVLTLWALSFTFLAISFALQYGTLSARITVLETQLAQKK